MRFFQEHTVSVEALERMLRWIWGSVKISILIVAIILCTTVPLLSEYGFLARTPAAKWIVVLNCMMWGLVIYWVASFLLLPNVINQQEGEVSIVDPFSLLKAALRDLERKEAALGTDLQVFEKSFFLNINKILNLSREVLPLSSAELTLVDTDSKLYHGSFLVGSPFRTDSNAAYREGESFLAPFGATVKQSYEQDRRVIMIPIAIAGTELGLMRLRFDAGLEPDQADWKIISIIVLHCIKALIENDFTEKVLRMREGSEHAVKSKTGFLAELSHEIRGPLGIMLNAVQLVLEGVCGDITKDQSETLSVVQQNGTHLLELVNDVLDFARAEAGRLPAEREPIQVNALMKDITNIVLALAERKQHRFEFKKLLEDTGFLCERRHARQILINIITNAIKYTPDGGVIQFWAEKQSEGKVRINVKDSGVGIPQEDQEKVFMPFERAESGYAKEQKGTGIGLSLTRELVELNKGEIAFSSEEGVGTHFWVEFESATQNVLEESKEEITEIVQIDGTGTKVLVMIGDPQERSMVARYLNHHKFLVCEAESFLKGQEILNQDKVEVIILDLQMVEIDDFSLQIARLRRNHSAQEQTETQGDLNSTPIIGVSGKAFHSDVEDALRAGIDLCIVKPLSLEELGRACQLVLRQ
jgi:signal transduction histidine kinase/CheY-like chemotaxis protein